MNKPLSPSPLVGSLPAADELVASSAAGRGPYQDAFYDGLERLAVAFIEKALQSDICSGCGGPTVQFYGCGC